MRLVSVPCLSPIGNWARGVGLGIALLTLTLVAMVQLVGIRWYFITRLGLDNGFGG